MLFSSMTFIFIFLPLVCGLYFVVPGRKLKNIVLCLFSLLFYAWGEPFYIFLMIFSVLINYIGALGISRSALLPQKKKIIFIITVTLNLLILFFFKYEGFFASNVNRLLRFCPSAPASLIPVVRLSLPLGISFYTFQALSYVIDVYKQKVQVQRSFFRLLLYVSLFPQLIAGPIVRYSQVEDEIENRKESLKLFCDGLFVFMKGMCCKVLFSNNLAVIADGLFADYRDAPGILVWLAALAYMLQIYFDFSGYSKMAIGLGKMFGFSFPENFNYPYTAVSVTDFWKRWHMTLSAWFRDYVYIPLGGNRCSAVRHIFNLCVTWFLTGFWHGASWNFILWGAWYAFFLVIEKYLFKTERKTAAGRFCGRFCTFFIVLFGWIIFRTENLSEIAGIGKRLFDFTSMESLRMYCMNHAAVCSRLIFIIPSLIFAGSLPVYAQKFRSTVSSSRRTAVIQKMLSILSVFFTLAGFTASLCLLVADTYNPFIYFRF